MTNYTKKGVGETAKDLILAGFSTKDVVRLVRQMVEGCRISEKGVRYYRWELRREGYAL